MVDPAQGLVEEDLYGGGVVRIESVADIDHFEPFSQGHASGYYVGTGHRIIIFQTADGGIDLTKAFRQP